MFFAIVSNNKSHRILLEKLSLTIAMSSWKLFDLLEQSMDGCFGSFGSFGDSNFNLLRLQDSASLFNDEAVSAFSC